MHYMGINDLEDVIHYELTQFEKNHGHTKILKILVSLKMHIELFNLVRNRTGRRAWELLSAAERDKLIMWNKIPIEQHHQTHERIIIVPEGTLAESIYI